METYMAKEAVIDDEVVPDTLPEKGPANDTAPMTKRQGADAIESLLGDDLDDVPDTKAKPADEKDAEESDPLAEDDDPKEDVDANGDDDKADGTQEETNTAGKYVSLRAKVKLADGTETTVDELVRGNLRQRDYSGKTEAVSKEREAVTQEKAEIAQVSQKLRDEREFLIWFAEKHIPQPPVRPDVPYSVDPFAHGVYREQVDAYNEMVQSWQTFKAGQAADDDRRKGETTAQMNARHKQEVEKLKDVIPVLKDPKKAPAYLAEIIKGGAEHYKLTEDEIAGAVQQDHRYMPILADALRYRRMKAKAPEVQKELRAKPRLVSGSGAQRSDPNQAAKTAIAKTTERLRATGSMRDGIAAIESILSR